MNKKKKMIMLTIVSVLFIMLGGIAIIGSEIEEANINNGTSNIVTTQNETTVEDQKELSAEEVKKAEALREIEEAKTNQQKIEAAKAEQAKLEEESRLEAERIQREAEIAEANRLEAERIAEEQRVLEAQRQAEIEASNNFYVADGVADHDHSTGYDSPYSDPNEPVITEAYGYIASGNSYIHKNSDCKFIRGLSVTQVSVSSSGKPSCNCWYY